MSTGGVLSGIPTTGGNYSLVVTVSDSSPTQKVQSTSYLLTITPSIGITTTSIPDGVVGIAYPGVTLRAQGGSLNPANYFWSYAGMLPAGLSLTGGTISGTPTIAGTYTLAISATDLVTGDTTSQNFTLNIGSTMTITNNSLPDALTGSNSYSAQLQVQGPGLTLPLTWTPNASNSMGLPSGLALTADGATAYTATVAGSPTSAVPPMPDGAVAPGAIMVADNTYRVDIDGQPCVVSYAGTSMGSVAGLVQINAVVPPNAHTGAAIPITLSIGSTGNVRTSQAGATIAIK